MEEKNCGCPIERSALIARKKVCRPKNQGGLGVLNLRIQNKALLLKNLHKYFNKHDTPWVQLIWNTYYNEGALPRKLEGSFWWKTHIKLLDSYKGLAKCNIGDGKSVFLWTDLWHNSCLYQRMPHLVTYAKKYDTTVHDVVNQEALEDLFHLPLSQQAFNEFQELQILCQENRDQMLRGEQDSWSATTSTTAATISP